MALVNGDLSVDGACGSFGSDTCGPAASDEIDDSQAGPHMWRSGPWAPRARDTQYCGVLSCA